MRSTSDHERTSREFIVQALPTVAIVVVIIVAAIAAFGHRYTLMIDPQAAPCIPGQNLFLVDKLDREPSKGGVFAMRAEGITPLLEAAHPATNVLRPFYQDGRPLIKVMDGVPGDQVTVAKARVAVNGEVLTRGGLTLTGTLMKPAEAFTDDYQLGADRYFMAGRTDNSFDSRYWGPIAGAQIIGRAYPIL